MFVRNYFHQIIDINYWYGPHSNKHAFGMWITQTKKQTNPENKSYLHGGMGWLFPSIDFDHHPWGRFDYESRNTFHLMGSHGVVPSSTPLYLDLLLPSMHRFRPSCMGSVWSWVEEYLSPHWKCGTCPFLLQPLPTASIQRVKMRERKKMCYMSSP